MARCSLAAPASLANRLHEVAAAGGQCRHVLIGTLLGCHMIALGDQLGSIRTKSIPWRLTLEACDSAHTGRHRGVGPVALK